MASEEDNKIVGEIALKSIRFQAKMMKIGGWLTIIVGLPLCLIGVGFVLVIAGGGMVWWSGKMVKTAEARIADGSAIRDLGALGRVMSGK